MRASIATENAGYPSVSLVCQGFEGQARATGRGHGLDGLALAVTRGHVDAQNATDMEHDFVAHTVGEIIDGLTKHTVDGVARTTEPAAVDIAASGTIDQVNATFVEKGWSDGLPIVPPTIERVRAFIEPSGHDPWKRIGVAKTSGRDITIWSIAVNAVMAGCTSAHMPVLIAIAEILCDPHYGAEHSGNTTGADALIILNGPSSVEFGFNAGQGALREGTHANTSVGRWLRLYLRNVFGFTTDQHDKATFGNSARVVLAERSETLGQIGWEPLSADFGFGSDDDVVTMARFNNSIIIGSVFGSTPDEIVPYIADGLVRVSGWELTHIYGLGKAQYRPLLILSPMLAHVFADAGWSKNDVRDALFEQARIPAWRFEKLIGEWSNLTAGRRTLADLERDGLIPQVFAESQDPDRLVPIVTEAAKFILAVAGDPNRANAYVMSNDGPHGDYTARRVDQSQPTDLFCVVP